MKNPLSPSEEPVRFAALLSFAVTAVVVVGSLAEWWTQDQALWALGILGLGGTPALAATARAKVTPVANLLDEGTHGPSGHDAPNPAEVLGDIDYESDPD